MASVNSVTRGEIYLVNFDPTIGSEIKKTRPALIIQNDISNKHSPITIVAAITSKYDEKLYNKPRYLVINKVDLVFEEERATYIEKFITEFKKYNTNTNFDKIFVISGITAEGCKESCYYLMNFLEQNRSTQPTASTSSL